MTIFTCLISYVWCDQNFKMPEIWSQVQKSYFAPLCARNLGDHMQNLTVDGKRGKEKYGA